MVTLRRIQEDNGDGPDEVEVSSRDVLGAVESGDIAVIDDLPVSMPIHLHLAQNDEELKYLKRFPIDLAGVAAAEEMLVRLRWLSALAARGYGAGSSAGSFDRLDVEFIIRSEGLPRRTPETFARWFAAYREDPSNLIPSFHHRGGKGQHRCDGRALEIFSNQVQKARESGQAICFPSVVTATTLEITEQNRANSAARQIRDLSRRTALRRFNDLTSEYERDVARYGARRTARRHALTTARPNVDHPGLVTESDDLRGGRFCLDPRTQLPFGTVWATLAVDQHSGYLTGLSLGHRYRSSQSAIECIINSIQSKERYVDSHLEGRDWPAMGYPAAILLDNAHYNNPRVVQLLMQVTDVAYARPYNPTGKREIEYFNAHVRDFEKEYLGGVRKKGDADGTKEALENAFCYVDSLERHLLQWAVCIHGNRARECGLSPMQLYIESNRFSLKTSVLPTVDRLKLLRMIPLPDAINWGPNGLRYLGLRWHDVSVLTHWINRQGGSTRVNARVDPNDLGHIYVDVPGSDQVLKVPSLDPAYATGLPLYQHKLILQKSKEMRKSNPSFFDMARARAALKAETLELMHSRKMVDRRRAQSTGEMTLSRKDSIEARVPVLEDRVFQLDHVEMEVTDETWRLPEDI